MLMRLFSLAGKTLGSVKGAVQHLDFSFSEKPVLDETDALVFRDAYAALGLAEDMYSPHALLLQQRDPVAYIEKNADVYGNFLVDTLQKGFLLLQAGEKERDDTKRLAGALRVFESLGLSGLSPELRSLARSVANSAYAGAENFSLSPGTKKKIQQFLLYFLGEGEEQKVLSELSDIDLVSLFAYTSFFVFGSLAELDGQRYKKAVEKGQNPFRIYTEPVQEGSWRLRLLGTVFRKAAKNIGIIALAGVTTGMAATYLAKENPAAAGMVAGAAAQAVFYAVLLYLLYLAAKVALYLVYHAIEQKKLRKNRKAIAQKIRQKEAVFAFHKGLDLSEIDPELYGNLTEAKQELNKLLEEAAQQEAEKLEKSRTQAKKRERERRRG